MRTPRELGLFHSPYTGDLAQSMSSLEQGAYKHKHAFMLWPNSWVNEHGQDVEVLCVQFRSWNPTDALAGALNTVEPA